MQGVFVFDYPACSCRLSLVCQSKQDKLSPPFATHLMHSSMQPPFIAHSPLRSPLCPLTSINVMVHQWWRTLSRGRTPLLIWLLLMGENTINKFNYPWPISNGGDRIIIHVISEVWIRRELITLVSCFGWTGYVNILHIHSDELLYNVKAREGGETLKMNTPCCVLSDYQFFTRSGLHPPILMTAEPVPHIPPATTQMMKTDGYRFN